MYSIGRNEQTAAHTPQTTMNIHLKMTICHTCASCVHCAHVLYTDAVCTAFHTHVYIPCDYIQAVCFCFLACVTHNTDLCIVVQFSTICCCFLTKASLQLLHAQDISTYFCLCTITPNTLLKVPCAHCLAVSIHQSKLIFSTKPLSAL
jgi:hypothetical protein